MLRDIAPDGEPRPWKPLPPLGERFKRTKCFCKACEYNGSHLVCGEHPEEGVHHSRIVILSEAPGADEDLQGRPLVGRAGIFFSKCLENAGIRRDRVWVTNVLLCRPPDNDITTEAAKHAIGCCEHGLREELEAAWKAGYRVIVAQGNTALHALGFEGMKITSYRGSILEGDTLRENGFPPFRVIPTLHPAALIRSSWKGRDGGTADPTMTYISDLEKARKVADPAWKPTEENFLIEPSYTEAYATLERWIKNRTTLAIDIETDGLNGNYAKPVCIGFAEDESHAMCLPIRNKGRNDLYWPEFEWGHLRSMVEEILLGNKLILQNAMFDIPFLKFSGEYKVDPHNVLYDTAVVHSLVAPEALHNLGYITSMFGTTSYWKDSFKNREGSIYSLDQRTLWTYNSRDCVVLWQVMRPMLELVKKNHLEEELALEQKLLPVLISMKINGIGFEEERLGEFKKKFEGLLEDSEKELRAIGSLPSHFNLSSKAHMRLFLYGYKSPSLAKAEKEVEKRENDIIDFERKKASLLEGTDGMKLTPARREKLLAQMEARILRTKSTKVLADAMAEAEVAKYTICPIQLSSYKPLLSDSGELSTADDAITSFRHALQKREFELERRVEDHEVARASLDGESKASARRVYLSQKAEAEAVQIGTMLNFIDAYSDWVEQQKLYSSFTKYKPALDGRIHPNYNAFGTATGRLSVSDPNLQQLPKKGIGKDIRKFFIASPGHKFISADYTNAEIGIMGCETQDPLILGAYFGGRNIHDDNTQTLFGVNKDNPMWSAARGAAKIFQFGRYQYGGSLGQIYKQVLLKCPDLNVTLKELEAADARWWEAHPAVTEWGKQIEAEVMEKRIIRNEAGRIRIFLGNNHDIVKEAKNFKIQSFVAYLANRALVDVDEELRARKLAAIPVLQVHDQLILEAPDEEVEEVCTLLSSCMTKPFMYKGKEYSLRADPSVGDSYGDLD